MKETAISITENMSDGMLDQCCHLEFLQSRENIDKILNRYGDIDYYENSRREEPKFGWLMKEPYMPCDHLTSDGCRFDLEGKEKPEVCRDFPTCERDIRFCPDCGHKFQDGKRTGECNRCR